MPCFVPYAHFWGCQRCLQAPDTKSLNTETTQDARGTVPTLRPTRGGGWPLGRISDSNSTARGKTHSKSSEVFTVNAAHSASRIEACVAQSDTICAPPTSAGTPWLGVPRLRGPHRAAAGAQDAGGKPPQEMKVNSEIKILTTGTERPGEGREDKTEAASSRWRR